MAASGSSSIDVSDDNYLATLRSEFGKSPQFLVLRESFLAEGRGRRKTVIVNEHCFTNSLLLQVFCLKEEVSYGKKKTWEETEAFIHRMTGQTLKKGRVRTLIERSLRELKKQSADSLSSFLDSKIDVDGLGSHLTELGLTESSLLNNDFDARTSVPSNGLIIELGRFQKKKKLPSRSLFAWICRLVNRDFPEECAPIFRKWVDSITVTFKRLQTKKNAASELAEFISKPFTPPELLSLQQRSVPGHELGGLQSKLCSLRSQLQDSEKQNEQLQEQVEILAENRRQLLKEIDTTGQTNAKLCKQIIKVRKTTEDLKKEAGLCRNQLRVQSQQLKALKKNNVVRRYQRLLSSVYGLKKKLAVEDKATTISKLRNSRNYLRRKLKETTDDKKRIETQTTALRRENGDLKRRINELESAAFERRVLRLKDPETNYFKEDAKLCFMQLVGEHEISAARCGQVIAAVAKRLFGATIPEDDLPSERTVGRCVDMGRVLGHLQIADTISNSERIDIHTDGTSRMGKKVVGQQIRTDSGQTLTCGFEIVATENANCLVMLTSELLEELAVIYGDDEEMRHQHFLSFLQKVSAMMSDRAAVMKCFGEHFNTLRRDVLQTDEDIDFLYCNAHFLLGMSSAVSKVLNYLDEGEPVGRELVPKFNGRRKGEPPACRYVREACSCLGPRGDERFGCRQQWLAYCLMVEVSSTLTSFKANRFNNLFEASAALHFHQQHINNFFSSCLDNLNWKQDGLLHDSGSIAIDNHLVALGLVFFRITGPYWRLLGQDLHYLDFYTHVMDMLMFLERWAENPADAFDLHFEPLFGVDMDCENNIVFRSLTCIPDDRREAVGTVLKALSAGFVTVINNQLKDFLPGGRYHAVDDPALHEKLQHSKVTNIVGEQALGDLDFSLFKRRNASMHYHTTVNILKRNKTLSDWLQNITPEERAAALAKATAQHHQLRKRKVATEKEALARRRELLEENRQKKEAQELKHQQRKQSIIDRLQPHGGPCRSSEDVQRLLRTYHKASDKLIAVKAELQFHKLVMGKRSPLLHISKKFPVLLENLHQFLGLEPDAVVRMYINPTESGPPARKRPRRESVSDSDSDSDSESSQTESESENKDNETDADFVFSFSNVSLGTRVAVAYEDGFYIGELEKKHEDGTATVNFMAQCSLKETVYKWPNQPDRASDIDEKFVFATGFQMFSTSGRFWSLTKNDAKQISRKYEVYKDLFFN